MPRLRSCHTSRSRYKPVPYHTRRRFRFHLVQTAPRLLSLNRVELPRFTRFQHELEALTLEVQAFYGALPQHPACDARPSGVQGVVRTHDPVIELSGVYTELHWLLRADGHIEWLELYAQFPPRPLPVAPDFDDRVTHFWRCRFEQLVSMYESLRLRVNPQARVSYTTFGILVPASRS